MTRSLARLALAVPVLSGFALIVNACRIDPFCQQATIGCAVNACVDLERDGDETDIDCGGSCAPCASHAACEVASDCASARCFEGACCEPPCIVDARSFGGPGIDRTTSATYLSDGTLVIAGELHDEVDFGGGPLTSAGGTDAFVVALAPDGSVRWQRRFGGSKEDGTPHLAVTPSGHIWVAGFFQSKLDTGGGVLPNSGGYSDLFVLELDAGGNTLQAKSFSSRGTSVGVSDIEPTADGGLVMAGGLGTLDFGDGTVLISDHGPVPGGPADVYVVKLDANLDRVWNRQLGDEHNDFMFGLQIDPSGNVVVGVSSESAKSFGGPPLLHPGIAIVAYAGTDGAYEWGHSYGGGFDGRAISISEDGHLFMTGNLLAEANLGTGKLLPKGEEDAFVARLDETGDPLWITPLPSNIESYALAVRGEPDGGIVAALGVTGSLSVDGVTATTGADSLVFVRLSQAGSVEWARNVGGIVLGTSVGLGATPDGYLLAFGGYGGAIALGTLGPARGSSDAFVATLLP